MTKSTPAPDAVRLPPRPPVTHDVKCWPEPFDARAAGLKPWELRLNDRDYRVGDTLRQRRWSPALDDYTGEVDEHLITWALYGPVFGLPEGYVIMSLAAAPAPATARSGDALRIAVEALELAAIRFDEIYEAAEVDDVVYRNEATIHGINGNADVAQAEVRQALSALASQPQATGGAVERLEDGMPNALDPMDPAELIHNLVGLRQLLDIERGSNWQSRCHFINRIIRTVQHLATQPAPSPGGWQDISNAPKDGTPIMVWADGFTWPEIVQWELYEPDVAAEAGEAGYWTYSEGLLSDAVDSCEPETWSHWQPLPAAPSIQKRDEG